QSIIADNWSLQNISELFTNGLNNENTLYIDINKDDDSYEFKEISSAIINIESLFDFITDIILRDQILVDDKFTHSWKQYNSPLNKVVESKIIREYPFLVTPKNLVEPRDEFVKRLCVTSDLVRDHEINVNGWISQGKTPNPYLSQTLWGGAGMLARGFVYEQGYTPHPIRKRLFASTNIMLPSEDSVVQLDNVINEKRANLSKSYINNDEIYSLSVNMPPLPIKVIQESNSVEQMISVALEMRKEYEELRNWLGCYQKALTDGSYKDILKFKKILHSISLYVDSKMGIVDSNAPTFTTGIGVLKIALKGQPINTLINQFGIRSMINELIISKSGNSDIKKFLNFFGEKNTVVGLKVLEHFTNKNI
ncbi:MAG: hypothetical protein HRT40_06420, partial [Campylobacteraceae bacterium]|nr:hypothetical protein [Campylobacteraceae bacterium]